MKWIPKFTLGTLFSLSLMVVSCIPEAGVVETSRTHVPTEETPSIGWTVMGQPELTGNYERKNIPGFPLSLPIQKNWNFERKDDSTLLSFASDYKAQISFRELGPSEQLLAPASPIPTNEIINLHCVGLVCDLSLKEQGGQQIRIEIDIDEESSEAYEATRKRVIEVLSHLKAKQ